MAKPEPNHECQRRRGAAAGPCSAGAAHSPVCAPQREDSWGNPAVPLPGGAGLCALGGGFAHHGVVDAETPRAPGASPAATGAQPVGAPQSAGHWGPAEGRPAARGGPR